MIDKCQHDLLNVVLSCAGFHDRIAPNQWRNNDYNHVVTVYPNSSSFTLTAENDDDERFDVGHVDDLIEALYYMEIDWQHAMNPNS